MNCETVSKVRLWDCEAWSLIVGHVTYFIKKSVFIAVFQNVNFWYASKTTYSKHNNFFLIDVGFFFISIRKIHDCKSHLRNLICHLKHSYYCLSSAFGVLLLMEQRYPEEMTKSPQLASLNVQEQWLYSKFLPRQRDPHSISKGVTSLMWRKFLVPFSSWPQLWILAQLLHHAMGLMQPLHNCCCCTNSPVNPTHHPSLTQENDRLHLRQEVSTHQERANNLGLLLRGANSHSRCFRLNCKNPKSCWRSWFDEASRTSYAKNRDESLQTPNITYTSIH